MEKEQQPVEVEDAASERCRVPIQYGNLSGQYFTQWRIDMLEELIDRVVYCYRDTPIIEVSDVRIWYDASQDFHRLEFRSGGHVIEVRYYIVFSAKIDGRDGWTGCPRYQLGEFAKYLRDQARLELTGG